MMHDRFIDGNCDLIALAYRVTQLVVFDQQQTIIDGIAKENTCKGFRNHTLNPKRLNDFRRLLSRRAAAKILPCHDDIPLLYLPCKFWAEWRKCIRCHVLHCLECQIFCRNNDVRVDIIAKNPYFSSELIHIYNTPLFCLYNISRSYTAA